MRSQGNQNRSRSRVENEGGSPQRGDTKRIRPGSCQMRVQLRGRRRIKRRPVQNLRQRAGRVV